MSDELLPSVEKLIDHLESIDEAYHIREHNDTVDFTIGHPDLWPRYHKDDEIRAIKGSSVRFGSLLPEERGTVKATTGISAQTGQNIHFPPARAELWEELEEEENFPDKFALVNGTFELGGLTSPPEGVCTPHLIVTEDAEVDEIIDAIDEIFRLYEEVYDGGEKAIKKQP